MVQAKIRIYFLLLFCFVSRFCSVYFVTSYTYIFFVSLLCFLSSVRFLRQNLGYLHVVDNDHASIPQGSVNVRKLIKSSGGTQPSRRSGLSCPDNHSTGVDKFSPLCSGKTPPSPFFARHKSTTVKKSMSYVTSQSPALRSVEAA